MMQRYALFLIGVLSCFSVEANPGISSIEFVENKGQWAHPFLYKAVTSNSYIYLEENGFTFVLGAPENAAKVYGVKENHLTAPQTLRYHAYKLIFAGALKPSEITGSKPQPYYHNYFLGNDSSRWKSNIYPVRNVDYKTLYPGIDLHIASQDNELKYDLIVAPGANTDDIQLNYIGVDGISVKDNMLLVQTSVGVVKEMKPYAYQYINGEKKEVKCRYKLKGSTVSFHFPQGYDNTAQLVIDPIVDFATFTGSVSDNWGFSATYDAQGNAYGGGITEGGSYPVTTGAFDVTFNGGGSGGGNLGFQFDITITKFNATGTANVYSTYIGGSDNEQPHSMVVDNAGNLIIAGRTYSSNYPTQNGYKMSRTGNDADIIVTKLNAAGSALVGSTYFGSSSDDGVNITATWFTLGSLKESYGDDSRSEVIIDNQGDIYVAGSTQSSGLAISGALNGTQDGVVLKFNSNLSTLIWGTYIGGANNDAAYALALNQAQTILYASGGTEGGAIPASAATGVYDATPNGGVDGFIARFVNSGSYTLDKGTYIGTSAYDQCFGVQVDMSDNVYAMGQTLGSAFPHTTVFGQPTAPQFIVKLDPALSALTYATRFGAPGSTIPNISPVAFLVDTCENVYISGWGGAETFNGGSTANMPIMMSNVSPPGILSTTTDGSDFYFMVMRKNGTAQLFGAYYGSPVLGEHVDGGTSRFDKYGKIYQAICGGCGGSSALPTTQGAYSQTNKSQNCNLAVIKIAFDFGAPNADFKIVPDTKICFGEDVQITNLSTNAQQYEWDFGDGSPVNTQQTPPPHNYSTIGTFIIRLIAVNPDACRVRDTAFVTVVVDSASIRADFKVEVTKSCNPYEAVLTNTSQYSKTPGSQSFTTFSWSYGFSGGSSTGINPGAINFPDTGLYEIILIMKDTTACNSPDTIKKTIHFTSFDVVADFEAPDKCSGDSITFTNSSKYATEYKWYFGDGDTSTSITPTHGYDTSGTYTVTFVAINPGACNKADTIVKQISVKPVPTADFTHAPVIPVTNEPIQFTNMSIGATAYNWSFGDGAGSVEVDPRHMYKKTGGYTVCLMAKNTDGCADTICKKVDADVQPLVDIPTGFSPNGDGKNDILYVRGAAVEKFNLRIYNRWGEKVFEIEANEVNEPKYGWNGVHSGDQQDIEAFAYVLSGTFVDGTTFYKKGNVTLLR